MALAAVAGEQLLADSMILAAVAGEMVIFMSSDTAYFLPSLGKAQGQPCPNGVNFAALPERGGRGLPVSVQEK